MKILEQALEDLDRAEDRDKFEQALDQLNIPQPIGKTALSVEEALKIAKKLAIRS